MTVKSIYHIELEVKDGTDTTMFDINLYLDLHRGQIKDFPFICSNIQAVPAYGIYTPQLIQYSRTCVSCQDFLNGGLLLTMK